MIKIVALIGVLFTALSVVTVSMAPDILSLIIVGIMLAAIFLGYGFGMVPTVLFSEGFRRGRASIDQIHDVQSNKPWLAAQQKEHFFRQGTLDQLFDIYVTKARQQSSEGLAPGDIEEIINDESLALRSWQSVMLQIPGTLTALGLLGTFVGLVIGISSIGFSSIEAALGSIELLLSGIETAFYTSIVGVILSMLFNLIYKLIWNIMLREMGLFMEKFHLYILPSLEEQNRQAWSNGLRQIIERLDRLPRNYEYSLSGVSIQGGDSEKERGMLPEIIEGLQKGEFVYYLQPRYDMDSCRVVGGEALLRWEHPEFGTLTPESFGSIIERNGFIVQINTFIWESVCRQLRSWIDADKHPVPITISVSKVDILAINVAEVLGGLIRKYRIPPRLLEIEINELTFIQIQNVACRLVEQLRQDGFRVMVDAFQGEITALQVLKKQEIDAVKLDLRLVNHKSPETIRRMFEQARKLNCAIMAEGIESAEQMTALRRCGCQEGQGYFLQDAMTVEAFEKKVDLE